MKETRQNVILQFNKRILQISMTMAFGFWSFSVCAQSNNSIQIRIMQPDGLVTPSSSENASLMTPLGSLWKLFAYAYLTENHLNENPYVCAGKDPEEIFCCKPGEKIEREMALAQSCSPYFDASRLSIQPEVWRKFWRSHIEVAPIWLSDIKNLKPEVRVPVHELLHILLEIHKKFAYREQIEGASLGSVLYGTARGALKFWGSSLRVKTFTWRDQETLSTKNDMSDDLGFVGGFAGWLPDGSAIWVSGAGHGRDSFKTELKNLVDQHLIPQNSKCVVVKYFDRYPISKIYPEDLQLKGRVRIKFKNGLEVLFAGDGTLKASRNSREAYSVTAHLTEDEYVARVLQREVDVKPLEAARAFALAIRTYLYQNAKVSKADGCLTIADSSINQRVSPEKASPEALQIAHWSDGLILDHVKQLRYHSTQSGLNQMSWAKTKGLALESYSMSELLKLAYPNGIISFGHFPKPLDCIRNAMSENWVRSQFKSWKSRLNQEPGFELPEKLKICTNSELVGSLREKVFSQIESEEIYVPPISNRQAEVSILHEYLHIAFRNHPNGRDEIYIENLAKNLLEVK